MPALPSFADGTFASQNRLEQNKAKHAVDVEKYKKQNDRQQDCREDQSSELGDARGIDVAEGRRGDKLLAGPYPGPLPNISKIAKTAASYVQLAREDSHQRQAHPLREPKSAEQLLAGVLKRGLHAIDGGYGHEALSSTRAE
jgi:hypothetical protein